MTRDGSAEHSLLPDGWRIAGALSPDSEGEYSGALQIWQDTHLRCRLVCASYGKDEQAAWARLRSRAEHWIWDYQSRPHTGDTVFGGL